MRFLISRQMVIGALALFTASAVDAQQLVPDGSSVRLPLAKGWKLETTDHVDGPWQVLTVEKKGLSTSGNVTVRWTPGQLKLDSVAMEIVSAYRRRSEVLDLNTGSAAFQERSAFRADFKVFPIMPFLVDVRSFHACGKTFVFIVYVAQEDAGKRQRDFQEIEAGFVCDE
ncbi:MAG: hypothetical protein IPJ76_10650 [Flavobacteriales bacterium]|nr:MAG: hypothetical protein IPJ76_10650 [Flavobacteriales bacterium]